VIASTLAGRIIITSLKVYWGNIPEMGDRALRVITLEDGETIHNAFFDRNFYRRQQRGEEPS